MRLKICGMTNAQQAIEIVNLGVDTLGFICVSQTPRYIKPREIKSIIEQLPMYVSTVGVFVNEAIKNIIEIVNQTHLTAVQLHGEETANYCQELRNALPEVEIIKAFRYQNPESLAKLDSYLPVIDTIILDPYKEGVHGGTGKQLNWQDLSDFRPSRPWLLAGGLNPENVVEALKTVPCDGIDISSGVEISPGNKDIEKVKELCQVLSGLNTQLHSYN
jgi:phosphoribosylanthranilate isomerase